MGRAALFVVSALAMAVGLFALGTSTSPDPVAVEPSTTPTTMEETEPPVDPEDFTVGQIERGEQFDWEETGTFAGVYPVALTEHEGLVYLFARKTPAWQPDPGGLSAWSSPDGVEWSHLGQVISDEFRVTTVTSTSQGLLATGARQVGPELIIWRSDDAVDWTATEIPADAGGPYVAIFPTAVGASAETVVVSAGVGDDFPSSVSWAATALGAGEDGLAIAVEGTSAHPTAAQPDMPALTTEDGSVLTMDLERGVYILDEDGATHTWDMGRADSAEAPRGVEVDLENEIVIFNDAETGEALAIFSFGELSQAETAYRIGRLEPIRHQALVFTRDGRDWTIQDIGAEIGEGLRVGLLEVSAGRIVATVHPPNVGLDPGTSPGFAVWSAPIR